MDNCNCLHTLLALKLCTHTHMGFLWLEVRCSGLTLQQRVMFFPDCWSNIQSCLLNGHADLNLAEPLSTLAPHGRRMCSAALRALVVIETEMLSQPHFVTQELYWELEDAICLSFWLKMRVFLGSGVALLKGEFSQKWLTIM